MEQIMSKTYKIPENWLNSYIAPRYPDLLPLLRQAAEITVTALKNKQLLENEAELLYQYACDHRTVLSDTVADMLGILANTFPTARLQLEQMTQDKSAVIRCRALLSASHIEPLDNNLTALLQAALQDRSRNIRAVAAQQIHRRKAYVLVKALAIATECETHSDIRKIMQKMLDLLQQGYSLTEDEDGSITACFDDYVCRSYPNRLAFEQQFTADLAAHNAPCPSVIKKKLP